MAEFNLPALCVSPTSSIREAMAAINRNQAKVALVVDGEYQFLDIITDGDVRRAILAGEDLDSAVTVLRQRRASSPYPQPVTAPVATTPAVLRGLMQKQGVRQVPLLDDNQRVVGLATLAELLPGDALPVRAMVMAGGYGTRLRPLTEELPKPMLPVGDRPLLERIIEQLRESGIRRLHLATHYKEGVIASHFGDGRSFGVEIEYIEEHDPLGTAGALSMLDSSEEPLLVINGDVLTRVDFRAMLDFHREHRAEMTVAVKEQELRLPYGVVEAEGVILTSITEKPVVLHFVNAGIYLLNPEVCQRIPSYKPYDMPDLIRELITERRRVVSFPILEYWRDIGQHDDYRQAQEDQVKWDTGAGRTSTQ